MTSIPRLAREFEICARTHKLPATTLATKIGVCEFTLLRYEQGHATVPAKLLYMISQSLNVGISHFFSDLEITATEQER